MQQELQEVERALIGKGFNQFFLSAYIADYEGSNYTPTREVSKSERAFEIKSVRYKEVDDTYVIANGEKEEKSVWLSREIVEELIQTKRVVTTNFSPCHPNHKGHMGLYTLNDMAIEYYPLGDTYQ